MPPNPALIDLRRDAGFHTPAERKFTYNNQIDVTDQIRPFFFIPQDASPALKLKLIEQNVRKCWEQLNNPKNGGWRPMVPPAGLYFDKVEGKYIHMDGKLNVVVMKVVFPPGHACYSEGCDTFCMRYRNHSFIRFWRPRKQQKIHLPDDVMVRLAARGKVRVVDWDKPESADKLEALTNPPAPTPADKQAEEHKAEERQRAGLPAEPVRLEVPYSNA